MDRTWVQYPTPPPNTRPVQRLCSRNAHGSLLAADRTRMVRHFRIYLVWRPDEYLIKRRLEMSMNILEMEGQDEEPSSTNC